MEKEGKYLVTLVYTVRAVSGEDAIAAAEAGMGHRVDAEAEDISGDE